MRLADAGDVLQHNFLLGQPLPVGAFVAYVLFELFVGNKAALFKIQQEHLAGLKSTFEFHICRVDIKHAYFGSHDALVIVGNVVAAGTQTISVQHCSDIVPVREHDRGRAIPGLHKGRVILVEIFLFMAHIDIRLPSFRNHHHGCFGQ